MVPDRSRYRPGDLRGVLRRPLRRAGPAGRAPLRIGGQRPRPGAGLLRPACTATGRRSGSLSPTSVAAWCTPVPPTTAGWPGPAASPSPRFGPRCSTPTRLEDALARLPARQRAAVVLRYYGDLPDADIADRPPLSARHRPLPHPPGPRRSEKDHRTMTDDFEDRLRRHLSRPGRHRAGRARPQPPSWTARSARSHRRAGWPPASPRSPCWWPGPGCSPASTWPAPAPRPSPRGRSRPPPCPGGPAPRSPRPVPEGSVPPSIAVQTPYTPPLHPAELGRA